MSVITTFEATPLRLKLLYKYLVDRPNGEERGHLIATAAPVSVATTKSAVDDSGSETSNDDISTTTILNSILEGVRLGLFEETDGRLTIGSHIDKAQQRVIGFDAAFVELLERLLLNPDAPGIENQRDVAFAFSWLLVQSPMRPLTFSESHRELLHEQLGSGSFYGLTNYSAFQNLYYWARALGYCEIFGLLLGSTRKQFVIADPTRAIWRHLNCILPERGAMRIADVLQALAVRCRVTDGGAVRDEVEGRRRVGVPEDGRISESLSLAILRLRGQGKIEVSALADADARLLSIGNVPERVTHIARAMSR